MVMVAGSLSSGSMTTTKLFYVIVDTRFS